MTYYSYNTIGKVGYLKFNLYYKTKTLKNLRKRFRKKRRFVFGKKQKRLLKKKQKKKSRLRDLFINGLKNKSIVLETLVLNKLLLPNAKLKRIYTILHKRFKPFRYKLFSRREPLYCDFMKLTVLFIFKKIRINTYITIIGTIFKFLMKKSHSKFFYFIKNLLYMIVGRPRTNIKGLKYVLNGKIKGKLRAKSSTFSVGPLGVQTISNNTDFAKTRIHTRYGCFGLKMWVNYHVKLYVVNK